MVVLTALCAPEAMSPMVRPARMVSWTVTEGIRNADATPMRRDRSGAQRTGRPVDVRTYTTPQTIAASETCSGERNAVDISMVSF